MVIFYPPALQRHLRMLLLQRVVEAVDLLLEVVDGVSRERAGLAAHADGGGVDEKFLCGAEESLKGPLLSPTRAVGSAWREAFIVGSRTVRASL